MQVVAHLLPANGPIPNHPRWPLLVYPGALALSGADPAALFEELFTRNNWPAAWRNGVHPFHHYHSNAHEALGVFSGEVTVQFGGENGLVLTAKPGDVLVLPAGTGHKKLSSKGALGVVGAYPDGKQPDVCTAPFAPADKSSKAVGRVPLPGCDPVFGPGGPLFSYWKAA